MKEVIIKKIKEVTGNVISHSKCVEIANAILDIQSIELGSNPFETLPINERIYNDLLHREYKNFYGRAETPKWIKLQLKKWAFIRGYELRMSQDVEGRYTIIHEK